METDRREVNRCEGDCDWLRITILHIKNHTELFGFDINVGNNAPAEAEKRVKWRRDLGRVAFALHGGDVDRLGCASSDDKCSLDCAILLAARSAVSRCIRNARIPNVGKYQSCMVEHEAKTRRSRTSNARGARQHRSYPPEDRTRQAVPRAPWNMANRCGDGVCPIAAAHQRIHDL